MVEKESGMIDIEWLFIHFSHYRGIVNGEKSVYCLIMK